MVKWRPSGRHFCVMGIELTTSELLTNDERCGRLGLWSQSWEKRSYRAKQFLDAAIRVGLTTSKGDFGQIAGGEVVGLFRDHELEPRTHNDYDTAIHLAALSDILTSALRPPQSAPWLIPAPIAIGNHVWTSGALLAPNRLALRRFVLVDRWSDDTHYHVCRSWGTLGEICAYSLPMELAVCVIGQFREGRYRSHWTQALRHPFSKKLRFRKKHQVEAGFKDTWKVTLREEHDEISTRDWLAAMMEDGVLPDLMFKIDVEVPEESERRRIVDLAIAKLDKIEATKELPLQNLSTCDLPPCPFRSSCHKGDEPSGRYGLVRLGEQQ
ncbi:MAG TPA: hypothetical protein VFW94_24270 [Candidatus Acidoferrales bacterium]|nr:hypothetical protein [Candidatus Acidoferrales bacterium]